MSQEAALNQVKPGLMRFPPSVTRRLLRCCFLVVLFGGASTAAEQLPLPELSQEEEELDLAWPYGLLHFPEESLPPWLSSGDTKSDWILLDTGEWLKGETLRMRNEEVVFVSAGLGERTIGWSKIARYRSFRTMVYVFDDRSALAGEAELRDGILVIRQGEQLRRVEKGALLSIVPNKETELSKWAFRATAGARSRLGNTTSADYTAFARLTRTDRLSRLWWEYNGAYGTVSGEENTNKQRGDFAIDLFLSSLFFVTPVSSEALYDKFQNIAFRWVLASGLGVHAIKIPGFKLDTKFALGYMRHDYSSALFGFSQSTEGAFFRPGIDLNWALSSSLALELQWQSTVVFTAWQRTFHHASSRLKINLTKVVQLDVSAIFDRQESPIPTAAGRIPDKNDLALSLGLGVEFK